MPPERASRPVGVVLPPGEQGALSLVLNQKVDVDDWREAAQKEKNSSGSPPVGFSHPCVQRRESLSISLIGHSGNDDTRFRREPAVHYRLTRAGECRGVRQAAEKAHVRVGVCGTPARPRIGDRSTRRRCPWRQRCRRAGDWQPLRGSRQRRRNIACTRETIGGQLGVAAKAVRQLTVAATVGRSP